MKYIFTSFFVLAILFAPQISKAQSMNIACVDLKKVVVESDQGKQIQKVLTDEAERLKKTLDVKQDELQKLKDAIEKQGATITPEARAEKEKYLIILEKSQGGILYSTPAIDITDKIIAAFNEATKKKTPAAPAPAVKK